MKKYCILLLYFSTIYSFSFAQNQTEINRLSIAKRSDGKGYVIRFHLSASLDSAKIIQPGSDLIQFAAYSPTLVLPEDSQLALISPIKEVKAFEIIGGAGFDIKIDGNLASVWTPYEFYVNDTLSHIGANSFTMIKENNQWLIIHLIDTRRKP